MQFSDDGRIGDSGEARQDRTGYPRISGRVPVHRDASWGHSELVYFDYLVEAVHEPGWRVDEVGNVRDHVLLMT